MHILVWHEAYLPGGGDRSLIDLISSWPDNTDHFTVMLNESHPSPSTFHDLACPILYYKSWRELSEEIFCNRRRFTFERLVVMVKAFKQIYRIIERLNPNAAILNNGGYPGGSSHYLALVSLAVRKIRPRIMIVRNFPSKVVSKFRIRLAGHLLSLLATRVAAVSGTLAKELCSEAHLPETLVKVVLNGVARPHPQTFYKENARRIKVIALIGSIEERKGHDVLLRSLALLVKENPDLRLAFTGHPIYPDTNEFKTLAKSLGIHTYVSWNGYNADQEAIYSGVDLVVMPSISYESFGRVAVEAMARGIPVIVSDCGGLSEIVQHGENGLIFPSQDYYALAALIARLINDEGLAARLRIGGIRAFDMLYNADRMAHDYYKLLHSSAKA